MLKYIVAAAAALSFLSCLKKALPPCNGNCQEVHITGAVTLQPGNTALAGQPVTVSLVPRSCIICGQIIAGSQKTDGDGKFDISFTFDSTELKTHDISIYIPNKPGTVSVPYVFPGAQYVSQGVYPSGALFDTTYNFQFYGQATLKVHLLRTANDTYSYFEMQHSFAGFNSFFIDYVTDGGHPLPKDTTFALQTAANVYTYVTASKTFSPGNLVNINDSIVCTQNGSNLVTINY